MKVEFVGQSSRDADNIVGDPSRLLNCYRERVGDGTPWLKSVPGMDTHVNLPGVFVTAMGVVDGRLFAVCNGRLFEIYKNGGFALLGEVANGDATIAGNNGYVTVQAGTRYFTYDLEAGVMTEPVEGAFSGFGSVETFGHYTILTEAGGSRFQWSGLAEPTDLPGLNFASADGRDDLLVRGIALHGLLYLFKQESHEIWALTGGAGAEAFERLPAGVRDTGLRAHGLICRFPGGGALIGSDNRFSLIAPGGLQPVSTPAVETAIAMHNPVHVLHYADEGHDFAVIVFSDAPAWVYDISTGEWHERAEGVHLGPWLASASCKWDGDYYVGRDDGQISIMRRIDADGTVPLLREAVSRTLDFEGSRQVIRELELYLRNGFADERIELAVSKDGGHTWTPWKSRSIGPVGAFGKRVIFRNLGLARRVNIKIRWSAPSNINISSVCRITV